jgi:hypothetical protein
MKKEIIKVVSATALCLGIFGAAFLGINRITLASATEGTQPLQLPPPAVNISAANVALVVSEENRKPDMELNVIFESDTVPSRNALTPEAAAEIGAQYIWDMFGESIDGKSVQMTYSNPPATTRAFWIGVVFEQGTRLINRESSIEDRMQFGRSTHFTFTVDAITGEWVNISTNSHWTEMSDEIRTARDAAREERLTLSQGALTEIMTSERQLYAFSRNTQQLDEYIEAVRGIAQKHFSTSEVMSVELIDVATIAYDFNENGLFPANRQLVFEVTDSTGRIADIAITETTKQLIWLNTAMNDIIPGWNYVPEKPACE